MVAAHHRALQGEGKRQILSTMSIIAVAAAITPISENKEESFICKLSLWDAKLLRQKSRLYSRFYAALQPKALGGVQGSSRRLSGVGCRGAAGGWPRFAGESRFSPRPGVAAGTQRPSGRPLAASPSVRRWVRGGMAAGKGRPPAALRDPRARQVSGTWDTGTGGGNGAWSEENVLGPVWQPEVALLLLLFPERNNADLNLNNYYCPVHSSL